MEFGVTNIITARPQPRSSENGRAGRVGAGDQQNGKDNGAEYVLVQPPG